MYESNDKMVSHPDHYQSNDGLEVIKVIEAFTADLTGPDAYYAGNIIKYACRWPKKNGVQDLEKLIWYATELVERLKSKEISTGTPIDETINKNPDRIYSPSILFNIFKGMYPDWEVPDGAYQKGAEVNTIYIWPNGVNDNDCLLFYYGGPDDSWLAECIKEFFELKEPEEYKPKEE